MAIVKDMWFVDTQLKKDRNEIALNMGDTSAGYFKAALFINSITTPDGSQTNPAYGSAPFDANEVSGTGYTAGGLALTSVVYEELPGSPGWMRWDFANLQWASSTITNARGLLFYVPSLSNRAVLLRNLLSDYSTNDGTFQINVHADGVAKVNLFGS
ncbi:hypothetical protein ACFYY8_31655 [Streptosporangium sp. NPDC001559]|uniref:hypothetical protein n=1 Tax=Streptosporangium sp. NPDC001559 TaxID=3366187 RepID=UPI0036E22F37